ncbi:hypothetical protein VCR12J2_680258 [Vibrio coralliirubri]|nr:hypothetical protein VCR12J2_680258 [Vibrio coralliirubri]
MLKGRATTSKVKSEGYLSDVTVHLFVEFCSKAIKRRSEHYSQLQLAF